MAPTGPTWQANAMAAVKAQPGKAVALSALLLVLAVLAVRGLGGAGPATAPAGPAPMRPAPLPPAPTPDRATTALHTWLDERIAPVGRNLFAVKLDYFPQDAARIQTLRAHSGEGFWDQLGKSMLAKADQEEKRKQSIENIRLQARSLNLQSTMMSQDKPRALVNGTLVGEGEVVAGFRLVKIEARRIFVEREGIKLEILFK